MATLFMVNVPHNCDESELCDWVESSGSRVRSVRLIRDIVSGASPSFAYVQLDEEDVTATVGKLNGQSMRGRAIIVKEARVGRNAA
jgi:RNA recognition motif-containing protein